VFCPQVGPQYTVPVDAGIHLQRSSRRRISIGESPGAGGMACEEAYIGRGHLEQAVSAEFGHAVHVRCVPWAG
jgi:hypothetical protein